MSNVLYKCLEIVGTNGNGDEVPCGMRLFAPPGGTPHHCPRHTEAKYTQVEESFAPNFEWKDEGDRDTSKTGVLTPGVDPSAIVPVNIKVLPPEMSENELLVWYRERYLTLSNTRPDMRWGIKRLKEEVEAWEQDHTPEPEATISEEDKALLDLADEEKDAIRVFLEERRKNGTGDTDSHTDSGDPGDSAVESDLEDE